MKKRLLASLLSATILLSMTPMAFADEEPVGEDITEPAQVETVDETVPQAEPQEEDNAPVVQEDPQAEETPADIVIDSDTTWSEARTLTGDLTVNSGATLTVALYVYAKEQGEFDVAFAIASILMVLTLLINLSATLVGRYFKKRRSL